MSRASRDVVLAWSEAINRRDVEAALALYTPDFVDRTAGHEGTGVAELRTAIDSMLSAFPDLRYHSEHVVVEGDTVVERFTSRGTHLGTFMGLPPTGRTIAMTGINIYRLADGRIAERWGVVDDLGMMHQLGLTPLAHHRHDDPPDQSPSP